jgi:hypothetical protein
MRNLPFLKGYLVAVCYFVLCYQGQVKANPEGPAESLPGFPSWGRCRWD